MMETTLADWNGEILPLAQARVSVLDRAFLFGDAVYEAMRIYDGRLFLSDRHFARLERNLRELRIRCDVRRVQRRSKDLLKASGVRDGLLYIQITRGAGAKRTHAFPPDSVTPNELIYAANYSDGDPHRAERATGVAAVTHPDLRWARRDVKSVNLLGNCLAAEAAKQAGAYEAILYDPDGSITEGTHCSVFAATGGRLRTSPLGPHILPGVTRGFVLELAELERIPVDPIGVRTDELDVLDEVFLTGTSTEVLAVTTIDGRPVGSGAPGPIARRLYGAFQRAVQAWLSSEGAA